MAMNLETELKVEHSFYEGIVQPIIVDHSDLKTSPENAKAIMSNMSTTIKVCAAKSET